LLDETLDTFHISRSLSIKGCSYDNAVAEATFKIIKTEFVHQMTFDSLEHLTIESRDYVNWFNKVRIHGTLGYVSPVEYKLSHLKKAI
jgi:transposase InsO family protein